PEVPGPCPEDVAGLTGSAGDDREDGFEQGQEERLREDPETVEPVVGDEGGAQAVTGEHAAPVVVRMAEGERLEMADPRGRGDEDPGADEMGAPAEVDVVTEMVDLLVEAAEGLEQIGAH